MPDIKRATAFKILIKDIVKSPYVASSGKYPSHILMGNLKISRVNMMCFATSLSGVTLIVDDGSGPIECKAFERPEAFRKVKLGSLYNIIGKVREYNGKRYVVCEILNEIDNALWISVWKQEINNFYAKLASFEKKEKDQSNSNKSTNKENESKEVILGDSPVSVIELIKELDDGKGAPLELVLEKSNSENIDAHIKQLLNEGEIFEISPGLLKVL